MAGRTTITTKVRDGSDRRLLQADGLVVGTTYSHTRPGGCEQLSATFLSTSSRRTRTLDPGRIVEAWRGASRVWRGIMDEPAPVTGGWALTAHGDGTWGTDFVAYYQGSAEWLSRTAILTHAAAWGLNWNMPSSVAGYLDANAPDPGAITVTDYLNMLITSPPAWWWVDQFGNLLIGALPDLRYPLTGGVTRLITAGTPPARTVSNAINTLLVKYTSSDSGGGNVTYATVFCQNPTLSGAHGAVEAYVDASGAVMTAAQATAYGNDLLAKYVAAPWSSPISATWGQLMNRGGVPCDPGCERAGEIYQVLTADSPAGGEVAPGPVKFLGGRTQYDDDTQTVTVTPYLSYRTNFGSLLAGAAAARAGR
jgi:hypothetical protein